VLKSQHVNALIALVEAVAYLQHHAVVEVETGADGFVDDRTAFTRIDELDPSERVAQTNELDVA
jgi:hypothetical protein